MSVAEFSKALKNRALQEWFKKERGEGIASASQKESFALQNINVLVNPVKLYRAREQASEKTAFIITQDTIKDLLEKFQGIPKSSPDSDKLSKEFFKQFKQKNAGVSVARRQIKLDKNTPAIYFPHISFDSITNLVNNIIGLQPGDLAKYFEKGHIVGLATELLQETTQRLSQVSTAGAFGKSFLVDQLDKVIDYYKRLDASSANIQPYQNVSVYGSFVKRASNKKPGQANYLVELQPKEINQGSAKEIQATLGSIRKLFSTANLSEKQILDLIGTLKSKVTDPTFQKDLLNMESSPSLIDMIQQLLINSIKGQEYTAEFKGKNVLIGTKKVPRVNMAPLKAYAKEQLNAAKRAKQAAQKPAASKRRKIEPAAQLLSLQNLLDSTLHEQLKRNMGSGNSKTVLNYRTGRFAKSVKVERLSESRQGMITAFYSYMKNPYATFSQGGRQQYPRSRDPKTLISKSIREIAQTMVTNQLRAVNV